MLRHIGDNLCFFAGDKYLSIHIKDPIQKAQGCVIWMHGLGSNAADMMGLADELHSSPPLRHVFLDAPIRPVTLNNRMPMRAWYDILGMEFTDREDREGIFQSEMIIADVLNTQQAEGFSSDTIFLAGFSQGAAMALFTGLRITTRLAGVIALSGYLPLASEAQASPFHQMPVFVGSGDYDPMVLPAWTGMSVDHLRKQGFSDITWNRYPMEHSICPDEIRDLGQWITKAITRKDSK